MPLADQQVGQPPGADQSGALRFRQPGRQDLRQFYG